MRPWVRGPRQRPHQIRLGLRGERRRIDRRRRWNDYIGIGRRASDQRHHRDDEPPTAHVAHDSVFIVGVSRVVACAMAVGCYSPSIATDVPCSANLTCPNGQVCDTNRPMPTCVTTLSDASIDTLNIVDAPWFDGLSLDGHNHDGLGGRGLGRAADRVPPGHAGQARSTTLVSSSPGRGHDDHHVLNYGLGSDPCAVERHHRLARHHLHDRDRTGGRSRPASLRRVRVLRHRRDRRAVLDPTGTLGNGNDWFALSYSGLRETSAYDTGTAASGSGTAMSSGPITTDIPLELLIGYAEAPGATAGNGFVGRGSQSGNVAGDRGDGDGEDDATWRRRRPARGR